MRSAICLTCVIGLLVVDARGDLFVGLEGSAPPTRSSDMSGFPNVVWTNHFAFDVSGAAARPDGTLFLCNGAFTTRLYTATRTSSPRRIATISVDIHALAYGRGTLWGFSNFAATKGIYEIDQSSGQATLVLDVFTGTGFRFFALDYNRVDGLLYGYTEFGDSGLYSINLDTGQMIKIVTTIPAANGQGRGMAIGNNTVYLTATRGDDDIPCFSYDLSQGPNGEWIAFTQPYPQFHSTGGAAWIPDPYMPGDLNCDGTINALDIEPFLVALFEPENYPAAYPDCDINLGDLNGDGLINALDIEPFLGVLFP
ncbi:MAG: hypothetical protein IID33_11335 [Planctomycetes bacterium]|nr:hypothetical protein [Planctomycetota bacterium]